jgi:hypothetical protein
MNSVTRNNSIRSAVVVLICLPLLYVASFGPACWLNQRYGFARPAISIFYRPVFMLLITSSPTLHSARGAVIRYMRLGEAGPMQPALNENCALEDWQAMSCSLSGGDAFRSPLSRQ